MVGSGRLYRQGGLLVAVLTAVMPPAAHGAGTNDNHGTSVFDLPLESLMGLKVATVTTASCASESEMAAPGTVVVVTRDQIRRRGYTTLVDVLRDLPGMDIVPYYFSEIGTLVGVRGISGNNKVIVLVNGMRVNPPGGEYYPLRTDLSVVLARQVEVIYGPGSTLYGEDAISAVINIVTDRPEAAAEGSVATGTDNTREAWLTFGRAIGANGDCRVSGYAYYHDSDLTRLDREYPGWWREFERVAQPKGAGDPPERQDFGMNVFGRVEAGRSALQAFHRESRRSSSEGFSPILGYVDEALWQDRSTAVRAENNFPFSPRVALESSLTYNRYEIDPDTRYVFPADRARWFLDDFKYGRGSGAALEETLRADVGERVRLLAGFRLASREITPKATVPGGADTSRDVASQAGSFVYYTQRGNPATRREVPRAVTATYETYAGFAETAWQAARKLKAVVGVRWTGDTRFSDVPFTPRAALIYAFDESLTLKYIATKAYVAPAPYFAYAPFDNGTRLATSNPDLEPEEAVSHEVNLRLARGHAHVSLSAFYGEQDNLVIVADAPVAQNVVMETVYLDDGSTRVLSQTVNGGRSRNAGVDLYGEIQLGRVAPWFSCSYVDYEEDLNGDETGLRGLSTLNGRLGATWAAARRLLVTPSLAIRSKPDGVIAGALDRELREPWEANLYVLYQLAAHVDLFARARNVSDHAYALGSFTGEAAPQETFNAVAGARVRF